MLFVGFIIDLFSDSIGFHSTALVFMAFIKPFISKLTIPHNILSETDKITLNKVGPKSFITFTNSYNTSCTIIYNYTPRS